MSVRYRPYAGETDLPAIMALVETELSEPYVIYTYRYFLHGWPHLSYIAEAPLPPSDPVPASSSASPAPPTASSSTSSRRPSPPPPTYTPVGAIVCKQDQHGPLGVMRGYIAMLSVRRECRKQGIGAKLVRLAIRSMRYTGAQEVMLETEFDNVRALSLYERLGFIREKRLFRFYLNGKDAFRLVLEPAIPEGEDDER